MKKILLASAAIVLLAAAGGGYYLVSHRHDPMQQAKAALQKGDVRTAGLELRTLVRDQPANGEAHALLSQVQIAQGDPVAAEKEIKRAAELNWNKEGVEEILAQSYLAQSKWKEIRAEIPRQGSNPTQTAYFLMVHATAERAQNNNAAAQATITEAERVNPESADVEVVAARFAMADGNKDAANQKLDRALELAPNRADTLSLKAQLLAANGDRAGALTFMDRAVVAAPTDTTRLERAALYLAQGQDAKAQADVEAVLATNPKQYSALYMNTVLLVRQGKFRDADLVLQRLDPVIAQFQRGLYFKAIVKANVGQMAQAEDSVIAYVARFPTDPDGVRLLGRIELSARHPTRAIPAMQAAVNGGQTDPDTLDLLGRAYIMDGKRAEAEAIFKQASASTSVGPAALTRLASSRLQAGDLTGAATDLERSLEIAPTQTSASEALVITALALGDFEKAQQTLDRLRQQAGDTEQVGTLAGLLKLAQLDVQGAIEQFQATATKFPDALGPKINLAKLLIQVNRRDDAEALLTQVLDKVPTAPEPLALISNLLVAENRGADALKLVERARAAEPTNPGLANGQAELYLRLQDVPKALQVLESFKVDGKTPTTLLPLLGRVQLASGQNDNAKASFAAWVAAEPANLTAVRSDVEVLARLKDFDGARRVAQDAAQRQPGNLALLQLQLAVELQDKGQEAALALAERLRAEPANMPAASVLKGDLLLNSRSFKEAAAAFAVEAKQEPSSVLTVRLAASQRAAGDLEGSDATLRHWLEAHPGDADAAQLLGSSDIAGRRFTDAERNLQIVLSQRPNDVAALNNLAWVFQERGDKRARQFAQRAYLQAPTPQVADTFAWILVSQGDSGKALPILQTAAAALPTNPSIRYHLAVALKDLNRSDEAMTILKPVVEGATDFDEKPAAQKLMADLTKPKP